MKNKQESYASKLASRDYYETALFQGEFVKLLDWFSVEGVTFWNYQSQDSLIGTAPESELSYFSI